MWEGSADQRIVVTVKCSFSDAFHVYSHHWGHPDFPVSSRVLQLALANRLFFLSLAPYLKNMYLQKKVRAREDCHWT